MHRTQIYLDEAQYEALQAQARREGKSMAAVLREILDAYLSHGGPSRPEGDPFSEVIGIGAGDGAPIAESFDDYLYGRRE
jgi:plasmid stability protein